MNPRSLLLLILIALVAGAAACSTPPTRGAADDSEASAAPALRAERFVEQGNTAFKNGDFPAAVSHWSEAAALFEKSGNTGKCAEALTKVSQAFQSLGQHQDGLKAGEKALALARQRPDERQQAEALAALASIRISLGENETAQRNLEEALATAKRLGDPDLTARILNTLGNLFSGQSNFQKARQAYRESASVAPAKGSTAAAAAVNSASASFSLGDFHEADSGVEQALRLLQGLEDSAYKAHGLINAGLLAVDLRTPLPDRAVPLAALASHAFSRAAQVCQSIGDLRTLSYAYGSLGSLYESEGRDQEALGLTRRAIAYARRSQAPESLYRWHWQSGRILKGLGKPEEAIAAYRQALFNLQTIRKELTSCTGDSSFRRTATQLCSQYVDLLLAGPDLFMLLVRLSRDDRVPGADKVKLGGAAAYFLNPLDLVPELVLGPAGLVDDVALAGLVLRDILERTDPAVVSQHWEGTVDLLDLIRRILDVADSMVGGPAWRRLLAMVQSLDSRPGRL